MSRETLGTGPPRTLKIIFTFSESLGVTLDCPGPRGGYRDVTGSDHQTEKTTCKCTCGEFYEGTEQV